MPREEAAIALELAALSVAEIVDAAGAREAPAIVRRLVEAVAGVPSRRLGKTLARFDADVAAQGLGAAATAVMHAFGARVDVEGSVPASGAVLVITNHPGAYDSLATMAVLGRDDVALLAADRAFLRAMPRVCEHLLFVADSRTDGSAIARAAGLRAALAWLDAGRVLVQYGAGTIEPDARFEKDGEDVLGPWSQGTGVLAARAVKQGASIVPAFVSGVHSARAKRLSIVRWAERRGITTLAPLLQATLPGFRDVRVSVRFGAPLAGEALAAAPDHQSRTALVRAAVLALRP
jgi:1-acyl-sn-glycerol-3-phosphate acyltransferase